MTAASEPHRGFRFPAEVVQHAVWPYHCFSLSLRDVETIPAVRGVVVSCESIREWGLHFVRSAHNRIHNHFQLRRHRLTADQHCAARDAEPSSGPRMAVPAASHLHCFMVPGDDA